MADPKTADFTSDPHKIEASQITDFYTRLNALRALNGGTTTVSFSAPSVGTKVTPSIITQAEDAVTSTKSALSFLASVNISTYTPTTPSVGSLIQASTTIHPIEWQVGQLESACFTNFTTDRSSVCVSNFVSFGSGAVACNSVYNSHFVTQYTANFVTQSTATTATNRFNTQYTSDRGTNFTSRFKTYFQTFRHYVHTSFNSGHGCNTFGTQFKPRKAVVYSSFFVTNFTAQRGSNNSSVNTSVHSSNRTANFTTQRASNCSPHFITFNSTVNTTVNSANCSANDSTNFGAFTSTYYANHSAFAVKDINF